MRYVAAFESNSSYCIVHKDTGIETFEQFIASDILIGATGKSSTTYTLPASIQRAVGANYQVITGFDGGTEVLVAMERGEVHARCGIQLTFLVNSGYYDMVNIVAEIGVTPRGDAPTAAFVLDQVEDPQVNSC